MAASSAPLLAVTIGDGAGIGPEVILKAIASPLPQDARPVIYGALSIMRAADQMLKQRLQGYDALEDRLVSVSNISEARALDAGLVGVIEVCPQLRFDALVWGQAHGDCATLQLEALHRAMDDVERGDAHAVCTAPWTKHLFSLIDRAQVGHTEVLAERFGCPRHVMMLAGERLRVSLVTVHVPLAQVSAKLSAERLHHTIDTTIEGLVARFGLKTKALKVAVLGLNPHAGEGGVMGDEEQSLIEPAINEAQARWPQVQLSGPWPGDTLFARFGKSATAPFDAVICMYHDQGLIPLKLLHFGQSANLTLGLPIIRTSVDHGTAYDIAGLGVADAGSMRYALELALRLR